MLLGCCHCGPIESQASVAVASAQSAPSGFNPSILYDSNSQVSVLPPNVNPVCAACYNFPVKWTVDFNQSWWTFNPGGGLGFPTFTDCPSSIATQSYLLRYSGTTGAPEGSGYEFILPAPCAVWKSDAYAIDVTSVSCTGKPTFPLCATDIFKRPRVEMYAYAWNSSSTLFVMTYSWAVCQHRFSHEWRWWVTRPDGDTISCVRPFNAEFYTSYNTWGVAGAPYPYYLAGATNPGKNILVSPA
jgi:hypothetical protein